MCYPGAYKKSLAANRKKKVAHVSDWSFTICPTSYNRKYDVMSASLNKIFPSFILFF